MHNSSRLGSLIEANVPQVHGRDAAYDVKALRYLANSLFLLLAQGLPVNGLGPTLGNPDPYFQTIPILHVHHMLSVAAERGSFTM